MYKICQTEVSSTRQRELEHGLLQLMLRHNYADISVSDLCTHMNIPRKSFYRYFSSKDGALYALIDHIIADFFEAPSSHAHSATGSLIDLEQYFIFWYHQKDLLDALTRSSLTGVLVDRANRFALERGHFPGHFKRLSRENQNLAIYFSVCGLTSMILYWHGQGFQHPPSEMTKSALDILTHPLIVP